MSGSFRIVGADALGTEWVEEFEREVDAFAAAARWSAQGLWENGEARTEVIEFRDAAEGWVRYAAVTVAR